ncbi:MAG: UTP--glucose-1-phosphate uridylyltransferase GalU [Bdellovibrionales bacterium]|nr:UTP--glucose-1-phosphate uridylyltransferase GalU [Bdellovibrionales bacterium]
MSQKIKKAVIPAAGLGTRFLPATKTVPKELFPLVDRPILLLIVEEAVRAGIEDIVIVAGRGKTAIEDFFDTSYEVEDKLYKDGKESLLAELLRIKSLANVISIRQKEAGGLGHAVLAARPVVGNQPFAVLLGDELLVSQKDEPTATAHLARCFESSGVSTVAVMEVPTDDVNKYGIIAHQGEKDGVFQVSSVVEKPRPEQAPSRLALPGRYVFDSAIFEHLASVRPGVIGEIQLTDGMTSLAQKEGLNATRVPGRRFDAGDKFGYLQASIELGLEHPEVGDKLRRYLKDLASRIG